MKAIIKKHKLSGTIKAPPSKSAAHRIIISAALSNGCSVIENVALSEDIKATVNSVNALLADTYFSEGTLKICGGKIKEGASLYANESGSTLRFLIPLCLDGRRHEISGAERLFERPLTVYEDVFRRDGIEFEKTKSSIALKGRLSGGEYFVPGNISSQFITGLLFALPLCEGESKITVTGSFESKPYVMMTTEILKAFGINVIKEGASFFVPGGQHYHPCNTAVEGDWSNAAFFKALSLFGSDVSVTGLDCMSNQGDKVCDKFFEEIEKGHAQLSIADCPDLAPVLFVAAARCGGAVFHGTRRLKIKESDRAAAMAEELSKMGVSVSVGENTVIVGNGLKAPTEPLYSHNDHRIAMALSVALTELGGSIEGAEAVGKSMPDFYERLVYLGAEVEKDEA